MQVCQCTGMCVQYSHIIIYIAVVILMDEELLLSHFRPPHDRKPTLPPSPENTLTANTQSNYSFYLALVLLATGVESVLLATVVGSGDMCYCALQPYSCC